eukprot:TRINITY_DN37363_c0_g1_i1.p1 TRINITY_DN37363_c0_g1~~TRINITY_DN37363_c0_g1_i1.p1  ORF type:complete len:306 (+),score=21.60 TRINITY_DN37363_c0_g1_i1:61-918(+)
MAVPCTSCGTSLASRICGGCRGVAYCSVSCQRSDWRRHKPNCEASQSLGEVDANDIADDMVPLGNATAVEHTINMNVQAQGAFAERPGQLLSLIILDDLLSIHVLKFLDPITSYGDISSVSSRLRTNCGASSLWEDILRRWSFYDSSILEVSYIGSKFQGKEQIRHVYDVMKFNRRFYACFAEGNCTDVEIDSLFTHDSMVIHPSRACIHGVAARSSWHHLLGSSRQRLSLSCVTQKWKIDDYLAVVVCGEDFGTNVVETTNVFQMCDGKWRLLHHHGSHGDRHF